jgi:hypothetical protein
VFLKDLERGLENRFRASFGGVGHGDQCTS